MIDNIFAGVFENTAGSIPVLNFILCVAVSLILGGALAAGYMWKTSCTKSFAVTMTLLPPVVCVVIMLVNGNIGAGVAVAGTFSLVRFRSAPGSAQEIGALFIAVAAGIACGMGYIAYAALFAVIIGGVSLLLTSSRFGNRKATAERSLRIVIPEDLDYTGIFDEIFEKYTSAHTLEAVKTTNLGSLFKLTYRLTLRNIADEKKFIDELRTRNGNLEITVSSVLEKERELL